MVTWNAEADAKLLAYIIQVYDVKVASAKLAEVATLMGDGCTPKALSHRIAKIKSLAKSGGGAEGATTSPAARKPASPKSNGKKNKRSDTPAGEDDDEEVDEKPKKKRAKKVKTEAEEGEEEVFA